jgi:hypothetical protein
MPAGLPCPNPACTHTFPHAQLRGASALRCPRCGTLFQFGGAPRPPGSPPLARRVAPLPPADVELVSPAAVPAAPLVSPRRHRARGEGWKSVLVLGTALFLMIGLAVGGILMTVDWNRGAQDQPGDDDPDALTVNGVLYNRAGKKERAFRLVLPRGLWRADAERKRGFKAVAALRRGDPDAWLAVVVRDYGQQRPREAELLKGAIRRLEQYFGENLQLGERPEPRELAGEPAQALKFRGEVHGENWEGECFLLTRHSLGYWFFVAAPNLAVARQVVADLQADGRGLVLDDERPGWSEQPPRVVRYYGRKARFSVAGREGVWQSFPDVKEVDPHAELFLEGRNAEDRKDNEKSGSVTVLVLDRPAPDLKAAMQAAREYVEQGKTLEGKGRQLAPADGKGAEDGTARKVGSEPGRVAELRLTRDGVPITYLLLAVVRTPGRLYVFQCESQWQYRQAWRRDFLDLLGTFRLDGR